VRGAALPTGDEIVLEEDVADVDEDKDEDEDGPEVEELPLANLADRIAAKLGPGPHFDYSTFLAAVQNDADHHSLKLPAKRLKLLQTLLAAKDEAAAPVVKRVHKPGKADADPLHGLFPATLDGKSCVVEYEPDSDLRDTEQVPLLEPGGIDAFFCREVRPYVPDAWINPEATKIGYEISFTRYFYTPQPLRTLAEIRADIETLEHETEGLLGDILVETEA
jgi:type I restriction enzyme M protein